MRYFVKLSDIGKVLYYSVSEFADDNLTELSEIEFKLLLKEQGVYFVENKPKTIQELTDQLAQTEEAAISAFEAQAVTDEAIIALYER